MRSLRSNKPPNDIAPLFEESIVSKLASSSDHRVSGIGIAGSSRLLPLRPVRSLGADGDDWPDAFETRVLLLPPSGSAASRSAPVKMALAARRSSG